jgi:hypothetical protein
MRLITDRKINLKTFKLIYNLLAFEKLLLILDKINIYLILCRIDSFMRLLLAFVI